MKGFFNEFTTSFITTPASDGTRPASVHFGTADAIDEALQITLAEAFHANPARFDHRPTPPKIRQVAYINELALENQIN